MGVDIITHEEATTRIEVTEVSGRPLEIEFANDVLRIEHLDSSGWLKKIASLNSSD